MGFPYTSKIQGSRHSHMRELRLKSGGRQIRILYAFDPNRMAVLLIGDHKNDNKRFYSKLVPLANNLYDEHIEKLTQGAQTTWEATTHGRT